MNTFKVTAWAMAALFAMNTTTVAGCVGEGCSFSNIYGYETMNLQPRTRLAITGLAPAQKKVKIPTRNVYVRGLEDSPAIKVIDLTVHSPRSQEWFDNN